MSTDRINSGGINFYRRPRYIIPSSIVLAAILALGGVKSCSSNPNKNLDKIRKQLAQPPDEFSRRVLEYLPGRVSTPPLYRLKLFKADAKKLRTAIGTIKQNLQSKSDNYALYFQDYSISLSAKKRLFKVFIANSDLPPLSSNLTELGKFEIDNGSIVYVKKANGGVSLPPVERTYLSNCFKLARTKINLARFKNLEQDLTPVDGELKISAKPIIVGNLMNLKLDKQSYALIPKIVNQALKALNTKVESKLSVEDIDIKIPLTFYRDKKGKIKQVQIELMVSAGNNAYKYKLGNIKLANGQVYYTTDLRGQSEQELKAISNLVNRHSFKLDKLNFAIENDGLIEAAREPCFGFSSPRFDYGPVQNEIKKYPDIYNAITAYALEQYSPEQRERMRTSKDHVSMWLKFEPKAKLSKNKLGEFDIKLNHNLYGNTRVLKFARITFKRGALVIENLCPFSWQSEGAKPVDFIKYLVGKIEAALETKLIKLPAYTRANLGQANKEKLYFSEPGVKGLKDRLIDGIKKVPGW